MSELISSKRVHEIFLDCLFGEHELVEGRPKEGIQWVECTGVMLRAGLVKERLESYRKEITQILSNLDESFMIRTGGGGMSFLNFCQDKEGHLWGEHRACDELICLGAGLGLVSFPMPRDMWSSLPGGVPYVAVDL